MTIADLEGTPCLYWEWNSLQNQVQLSQALSHLLQAPAVLSVDTFKLFWTNEDAEVFEKIFSKKSNHTLYICSYQLRSSPQKIYLQHQLQLKDHLLVSWCSDYNKFKQIENDLIDAQVALGRSNYLLNVLQEAQPNILLGENIRRFFDKLLSYLLNITESEYGFMGEVLYNKKHHPYFKTHSITNMTWNKEGRHFYREHTAAKQDVYWQEILFDYVMKRNKVVISNHPITEYTTGNSSKASPTINTFLGLPVYYQSQLIGIVCVANRTVGYNKELVDFLDPFLVTYGTLIQNLRLSEQQQKYKDELIIAKEMTEQALEARTRFFTSVSHELRTPLSLIIGPVSSLLKKPIGDFSEMQVRNSLEMVQKNTQKLVDLVEEILQLSKGNMDILEVVEKPVSLYMLVKNIFHSFSNKTEQKNHNYQFVYLADKDLIILLDQPKAEKIINNLISNAIKFTPEYGAITFTVKVWNDEIKIEVRDTGIGIPQDRIQHIFDLYYQVEQDGLAHGNDGLGIGLALSKELSDLLSGRLEVVSTYGMGSSFLLSIPLKIQNEVSQEEDISIDEDLNNNLIMDNKEEVHVLLVEDNHEMLEYLRQILLPFFNISLASNGQVALELLRKRTANFDLIITDLMMPTLDGLGLLDEIKKEPDFSKIPTIVLTAISEEKTKLQVISTGIVDDYLMKPFIPEELFAAINNCLKNHHNREQFSALAENTTDNKVDDLEWLNNLRRTILDEIDNHNLTIASLSQKLFLSERQLYREVQRITGMTPLKFIKEVRLQHARVLLETKKVSSIREVCYSCGFGTVAYFSQLFHKRFGKKPSSYF